MQDHANKPGRSDEPADVSKPAKIRHKWRRRFAIALLLVAVALVVARIMLPSAVRRYVQRTLDQSELYQGQIGDIDISLIRGAYAIHDVRIIKRTGAVPVPLFAARQLDLSIQWNALLEGKIVGEMVINQPELNFVDAPDDSSDQTGAGGPWLEIIQDLFPFRINRAKVVDGSVHFRVFQTDPPVDVYLSDLQATVDNLTNIHDEITPLHSTVEAKALAMDHAKFEYEMKLDPFSYRPTFELAVRLLGLDVRKINQLSRTYGSFDFERGWFDLVIEADAREGLLDGYVKPLFRDIQVFSLDPDVRENNVLELFWEAVVGVSTGLLTNQPRDQFGTRIPFKGDLTAPDPDFFATIGNLLHNAFVRAYLPDFQSDPIQEGLQFEPGSVVDQPALTSGS